jgi:hypothetical protein
MTVNKSFENVPKFKHLGRQQEIELHVRNYKQINLRKCKAIPIQAWTGPLGFQEIEAPRFPEVGTRRW